MEGCGWEVINGMHGYQERLYFNCISIHYAGRADMGVWLEMSGQGCRAFETYGNGDYITLFSLVLEEPLVHITRLDIAFDEYTEILNIDKLCSDTLQGRYRSKMDFFEVIQSSNGKSIDIGSKQSDVMIRIYDKLSERLSKLRSEDDKEKIREQIPHWIRVEIQLRDERAKEFIRLLYSGYEIGTAYTGVIRNYLEYGYYREKDGKNIFCPFVYWEKLLDGASPISIYKNPGVDYNLERCENYVFNSAGNAVDALIQIHGKEKFIRLLSKRKIQQNPKYISLVKEHKKDGKNNKV